MTTRQDAEILLWFNVNVGAEDQPEVIATTPVQTCTPTRRRVKATYCPRCSGWVEVRLQPVRLRCTGCGLEARP
jgi:hypothetical protein